MLGISRKDIKKFIRPEFLIYFFTCFFVLYRGIIYELDSYAFLSMEINRSSGYIIFLSFFKSVFGTYFEYPLLITQLILNIYGVYVLHTCLERLLKLKQLFSILSLLILIAPLLYLYLTANKILTEALAYPLYLIFIANCVSAIAEQRKKNLIYGAIVLLLLIYIRGQFLSLVPIGLISVYLANIKGKKNYLIVGLLFVLLPFVSGLLDKSFHYFQYGHFVSTPFTGPSIGAAVFYVADKEDVDLFHKKEEKEYFRLVKERLDAKKWTNTYANAYDSIGSFGHFRQNYSNICNQTIHEYGLRYFEKKGLPSDVQYIETDKLTLGMYKPLLLDNFKEWLKLYIQNIKASLGNSKYLILHLILLGIGIFLVLKRKDVFVGKFIVFVLLCTFSNMALVAIATHSEKRYMFYNDWVLFVILFLLLDRYFKTISKEDT
ncbi:hypothetical protein [Aquimarina sp. 2201CG14-23]|uniref:hypothetical protein n=1 Tax=Aquimarina mycalae TaxID=3040073 RepID=UPI002478149C|nr:hypothetical protein [Aquimarina sp. 2201CG14-23]MDH7444978.1 hypothetical protein [Aquimarina sp. 2201CG14-23]